MAREVLSNGVINPDKYQADWYADLSNNWHLLNNLIGSAISSSEVDSKIATAIQELMIRTFQIVAELPATGTEGVMYLVLIPNTSKYTAYVWENNAYRELGVIQMTITIDDELSTTSENPVQNKVITNALGGKANSSHTHSASDITSGLATVATSGSYNDLSNKPTIPTVNNATLTIQKNGTNVQTFTANQSTNATANITVPTKTSDLTNDSGFITSDNTKIPLAGSNQISGSLIPATDNSIDIGSSTNNIKMLYTKGITIDGTQFLPSDYVNLTGAQTIGGIKTFSNAPVVNSINLDGKTIDTDANGNMTYDSHIVDTIEEQGNGYIRYTNGIQICWGSVNWQTKISTLWGVIYESVPASGAYARSFIETPRVSACNTGFPFAIIESSGGTNTGTPSFYLCRGTPVDAINNCIVDYIAIGRWK